MFFSQQPQMSPQKGGNVCILCWVQTTKVGFYIVNFFLLFSNKSQKDSSFWFLQFGLL